MILFVFGQSSSVGLVLKPALVRIFEAIVQAFCYFYSVE